MKYMKRVWLVFCFIAFGPFAAIYVITRYAIPEIVKGERDDMPWNPFA